MKLSKSSIQFKFAPTLLIIFALGSLAICQSVHAVVPAPDGGYPGLNTAEGQNALFSLTTGSANTAIGYGSLISDTDGSFNTAVGAGTLLLNTGDENTAVGVTALLFNTDGAANTAIGAAALLNNTNGIFNNAVGDNALMSNQTGQENNALGAWALRDNIDGSFNTAIGDDALTSNVSGNSNTAVGDEALASNVGNQNGEGTENTALGATALLFNTTGYSNTASGAQALYSNTTGVANTAFGHSAGYSLTTGNGNVCIGAFVSGVAGESHTTRIRNIGSTPIVGGMNVVIDAIGADGGGILGYASSSRRYKRDIKAMDKASESLFALKPVTFRAKGPTDSSTQVKHYGLIAEEVATADPDLVVFNPEGRPETIRFDSINAMLLNEFLKEHRKVEEQGRKLEEQVATIARQQDQIDALTAGLQRVSAEVTAANGTAGLRSEIDGSSREADMSGSELVNASDGGLELSKSASRTASNNH